MGYDEKFMTSNTIELAEPIDGKKFLCVACGYPVSKANSHAELDFGLFWENEYAKQFPKRESFWSRILNRLTRN